MTSSSVPSADWIADAPTSQRQRILAELEALAATGRLAEGLIALFRQQLSSGYVLYDPDPRLIENRRFVDAARGLTYELLWNPQRELRKHHAQLLARGVVRAADPQRLINRDERGIGCYLCPPNIALQSPGEILLPLRLGDDSYCLGANIAPIAGSHFTVMSEAHRPQRYHAGILRAGLELVARTAGRFRVLFNGRAGASIEQHEHLQATDASFPVERLNHRPGERLRDEDDLIVAHPDYDLPLWLVESDRPERAVAAADAVIRAWHRIDPERHTENLLLVKARDRLRVFIFLRDRARLAGPGRRGALASFEVAGKLVLSHAAERELFDGADLARVRALLAAVAPERPLSPRALTLP